MKEIFKFMTDKNVIICMFCEFRYDITKEKICPICKGGSCLTPKFDWKGLKNALFSVGLIALSTYLSANYNTSCMA